MVRICTGLVYGEKSDMRDMRALHFPHLPGLNPNPVLSINFKLVTETRLSA
jgi:hypothetical protein